MSARGALSEPNMLNTYDDNMSSMRMPVGTALWNCLNNYLVATISAMGSALPASLRISRFLTEGLFGYQSGKSVKICQHLSIVRTFFPNRSKLI